MNLDERRAGLRSAARSDGDLDAFRAALGGADEAERTGLARTLPAARLIAAEGRTPRAAYVLTALGSPSATAEQLIPFTARRDEADAAIIDVVCSAAVERSPEWGRALIEEIGGTYVWSTRLAWQLSSSLVRHHAMSDPPVQHYRMFLSEAIAAAERSGAANAVDWMERTDTLDREFFGLFRTEVGDLYGFGAPRQTSVAAPTAALWDATVVALAQRPERRARLLDASLDALLRDLRAIDIVWYVHVHRRIDPTPAEVLERESRYLAVLTSTPSTAVALAQDMLARSTLRDVAGLLDASAAVLGRTEKKLVKAQLSLLARAAGTAGDEVAALVEQYAVGLPRDLQKAASALVPAATRASGSRVVGEPVAVPGPRDAPLLREPGAGEVPTSFARTEDFLSACAAWLEGAGEPVDLPRVLHHLVRHPEEAAPLATRAGQLAGTESLDPQVLLARRVLGERLGGFAGYEQVVPLPADAAVPPDVGPFRFGTRTLPSHSPRALLIEQFCDAALEFTPLPASGRTWRRVVDAPGPGRHPTRSGAARRTPSRVDRARGRARGPSRPPGVRRRPRAGRGVVPRRRGARRERIRAGGGLDGMAAARESGHARRPGASRADRGDAGRQRPRGRDLSGRDR